MTPNLSSSSETIISLVNQSNSEGPSLGVTDAACQRLRELFKEENQTDPGAVPVLSLRVDAGGCSGFQYFLDIITAPEPECVLLSYEDVTVAIDESSLDLLKGSYIDFAQEMMGAAFVIRNPNATSSCGCGNSFSVF